MLRRTLAALPPFPAQRLLQAAAAGEQGGAAQLWRAYLVLSFIAHVGGPGPGRAGPGRQHARTRRCTTAPGRPPRRQAAAALAFPRR